MLPGDRLDIRPVVHLLDHWLIGETRGARPPDGARAPSAWASRGGAAVGRRVPQRRVAALMADLHAHTRFQAGVQAALRGYPNAER
jgi:hypothetical protein